MTRQSNDVSGLTGELSTPDVIVVGAGMAGLCAAAWIARSGARVTVLAACG